MANSIKVRAKAKDDTVTVKALIKHPMETGLRKDKKTGKVIPAHFIQEVSCKHNGKDVLVAEWGPAEIAYMDDELSFKGRIERDNWIEQARELAAETSE